jgi:hypothetical protein
VISRVSVLSFAFVMLAGCGTVEMRHDDFSSEVLKSGSALLLVSWTASQPCTLNSTSLHLRKTTAIVPDARIFLNHANVKSEFAQYHGGVRAVRLAPGALARGDRFAPTATPPTFGTGRSQARGGSTRR